MIETDIEIINRLKNQEQEALSTLYDRYGAAVYSLAMRVLSKKELAEEVVQDVFLTIWNKPERWQASKGALLSWMLTITRYRSIDCLRREQRLPDTASIPLDELPHLLSQHAKVNDSLWENGQVLQQLLYQLPELQREMIDLAFFKGMTHDTIAEVTDLPLGTVKSRLRAGLIQLRRLWLQEVAQLEQQE